MISSMFSGKHRFERDKDGCPFIDRPGTHFGYILNYLRDRTMLPPNNIAMQVYTEAQYYQISTLIKKLESMPDVFRFRLTETRKDKLKNFETIRKKLIQIGQRKSEENLKFQSTVNLITLSDKKKLEDPCECVLNEHLLSITGVNSRQETFNQTSRRLKTPDIVIDDGPNFNIKLFLEIVEQELKSDGYNFKIWMENLKCLYKSNYTRKECRFEINEYTAEFKWE